VDMTLKESESTGEWVQMGIGSRGHWESVLEVERNRGLMADLERNMIPVLWEGLLSIRNLPY